MTDTGSHITLCIHLMYSMPTFDTLFSIIIIFLLSLIAILTEWAVVEAPPTIHGTEGDVDAGI